MSCIIKKNTLLWLEAHLVGTHSPPVHLGMKPCLGLGKENVAGLAQLLPHSRFLAFYPALVLETPCNFLWPKSPRRKERRP